MGMELWSSIHKPFTKFTMTTRLSISSPYNISLRLVDCASFINTLLLFQLDTLLFSFLHLQFFTIFLYTFRTGWSIIRRIRLHLQDLAPFPHSLLSRAWPLVLTEWPSDDVPAGPKHVENNCKKIVNIKRKMKVYQVGKEASIYKWCTVNQA
jgi:hypothetical protein